MHVLRLKTKPMFGFKYSSWPIWHDNIMQLPRMQMLERINILMVTDLLDPTRNILSKEEIETLKV